MNRRSHPLWLLRDLPALIGIVLSFWPLMILVISSGQKAMRGKRISPRVYQQIMTLLPVAEAWLRYALLRQAHRAFGWNPRAVRIELIPEPATWAEVGPRFEAYRLAMSNLCEAAEIFTELQRRRHRIRASVDANATHASHGSTVALRAARRDAAGVAAASSPHSAIALMASDAQNARASNDAGALANARGPPRFPAFRQSTQPYLSAPRATETACARLTP